MSDAQATPRSSAQQDTSKIEDVLGMNRRVSSPFMVEKTRRDAGRAWDKFYKAHEDRFFKNRNWTDREFDELREDTPNLVHGEEPVLLEVGCGVGNTVYPLLEKNAKLRVHCFDFSPRAIDIVQKNPCYDQHRVNAFIHDLLDGQSTQVLLHRLKQRPNWPPVSTLSIIFVLSAIPPQDQVRMLRSLITAIPLGATVVFRDYAHGDLAHLRFHTRKDAQWSEPSLLSDAHHWYRRGDHTMAYFFSRDEVERLFAEAGGVTGVVEEVVHTKVNRKTSTIMERRFIQAQFVRIDT